MKIFVGNVGDQTTEQQVQQLFAAYGVVKSVAIVTDNYTKRSRGFGFVEMDEREAGEKAIAALNNTFLNKQSIVVNEAKDKPVVRNTGGFFDTKRGR